MAPQGLITRASAFPPRETADRLAAAIKAKGMNLFARIDHAAGAASIGMDLRPTEVLVFGHPKGGTPLMQARQTIGIDLPLKVLVWADADGQSWISYEDPAWLAGRHGLPVEAAPAVAGLAGVLEALTKHATAG